MPAERRTSFFRPATLQQPIWETIRRAAAAGVEGSANHTPGAASPSPLGGPMCHHGVGSRRSADPVRLRRSLLHLVTRDYAIWPRGSRDLLGTINHSTIGSRA